MAATITTQPVDSSVAVGSTHSFTVGIFQPPDGTYDQNPPDYSGTTTATTIYESAASRSGKLVVFDVTINTPINAGDTGVWWGLGANTGYRIMHYGGYDDWTVEHQGTRTRTGVLRQTAGGGDPVQVAIHVASDNTITYFVASQIVQTSTATNGLSQDLRVEHYNSGANETSDIYIVDAATVEDAQAILGGTQISAEYQWFVDGVAVEGATSPTFDTLVASTTNSYALVTATVVDTADNIGVTSDVALAISLSAEATATRHGLVFNYDDNNFTWKDTLIEIGNDVDGYKLYDIKYETYGFTPGWQARWEDYKDGAVKAQTWENAKTGTGNRWSDTYGSSNSKEVMQVSNGDVYQADQVDNRQNSLKSFFVERTQMDLDDMNPAWTTNKIKQIKQFVFHMQSDMRFIDANRENTIDFYVGWSNNLMDEPEWKPPVTVKLEDRASGGAYKVDYRTSGRYLSTRYDLTDSVQLAFTGGDIDANEVAGR